MSEGAGTPARATELAVAALEEVNHDPVRATDLARQALAADPGPGERITARRALAIVAGTAGDPTSALREIEHAMSDLPLAPELRPEVLLTRASALHASGRSDEALSSARTAQAESSGIVKTRARLIEGTILGHTGNPEQALEAFAEVEAELLPVDQTELAALHLNRSSMLIESGRSHEAIPDLDAAARLYDRLGNQAMRHFALVHLAVAAAQAGDVGRAFRMLGDIVSLGDGSDLRLTSDLGRALLLAKLFDEALELAERSMSKIDAATADRLAPFVVFIAAAASFELGARAAAAEHAVRAAALASNVDNRPLEAAARLLAAAATDGPTDPFEADDLAQLDRSGWVTEALDARLRLALRALGADRPHRALALLDGVEEPQADTPAAVAARRWLAIAHRCFLRTDVAGTDRALIEGAAVAEQLLTVLGSFELRSRHADALAAISELGVRHAIVEARPPAEVLEWIERARSAAMWFGPAPTADPELGALLDEGRRLRLATEGIGATASIPAGERLAIVETEIQRRLRATSASGRPPGNRLDVSQLQHDLEDRVLVSYSVVDGRCVTVVVSQNAIEYRPLDTGIDQIALHTRAVANAASRLALGRRGPAAAGARSLIHRRLDQLDAALVAPIRSLLGTCPLVISPHGPLRALPWRGLPSLADTEIDVAPSAAIWRRAGGRVPSPGSVHAVIGPGVSGDEARGPASPLASAEIHAGDDATTAAVLEIVATAGTLHLACHGRYRASNPIFSELTLADGPLWLGDLARVSRVPDLIVLAACEAAQSWIGPADDEIGIAAQFLQLGARTVIAPLWIADDQATADLMDELHTNLQNGDTPARALHGAAVAVRDVSTAHEAASLGFLCLGRSG